MSNKNQDEKFLQVTDLEDKLLNLLSISSINKIVQIRLALMLCDDDYEKALEVINKITEHIISNEKEAVEQIERVIFRGL